MANIVNIKDKLQNVVPKIEIADGEVYEINDTKDVVLGVQQLTTSGGDMDVTFTALEMLLGKEAMKEIEDNHPGYTTRLSTVMVMFKAVMAALSGTSYDEVEKESGFRKK